MKNRLNNLLAMALLGSVVFLASCSDDDAPPPENEEEEITTVTLTFTPEGGGTPVVASWFDADGEEGPVEAVKTPIVLAADTEYDLSITLTNVLADDADEMDVTAEIRDEEPDEHMIFFGFTNDVFANPTGDGNIGANSRNDEMRYDDTDGSNPIGLLTSWLTASAQTGASFTVVLKHQPALTEGGAPQKSDTSTSLTGEDDFNLTFDLTIQ